MKRMPYRISVCGKREVDAFAQERVTHLLSLEDPEVVQETPAWFNGEHRHLTFHDVESTAEAKLLFAVAPTRAQVAEILKFGEHCRQASAAQPVHLLVHCFAGISRSTAAAYVVAAQTLGAGHADDALRLIQTIRREAFPNRLIVQYADHLLHRAGELLRPLESLRQGYGALLDEWAKAGGWPSDA